MAASCWSSTTQPRAYSAEPRCQRGWRAFQNIRHSRRGARRIFLSRHHPGQRRRSLHHLHMESQVDPFCSRAIDPDTKVGRKAGCVEKPMSNVEISGVFAALLTPRNGEDSVDVPALRRLVHFLTKSGISSFAVNGATGEFCLTSPADLWTMLSTVRARGEGKARILCCVGGAGAAQPIGTSRRVGKGGRSAVAHARLLSLCAGRPRSLLSHCSRHHASARVAL
jgi:hypothetical protein